MNKCIFSPFFLSCHYECLCSSFCQCCLCVSSVCQQVNISPLTVKRVNHFLNGGKRTIRNFCAFFSSFFFVLVDDELTCVSVCPPLLQLKTVAAPGQYDGTGASPAAWQTGQRPTSHAVDCIASSSRRLRHGSSLDSHLLPDVH